VGGGLSLRIVLHTIVSIRGSEKVIIIRVEINDQI
jgi:hypothetical protein